MSCCQTKSRTIAIVSGATLVLMNFAVIVLEFFGSTKNVFINVPIKIITSALPNIILFYFIIKIKESDSIKERDKTCCFSTKSGFNNSIYAEGVSLGINLTNAILSFGDIKDHIDMEISIFRLIPPVLQIIFIWSSYLLYKAVTTNEFQDSVEMEKIAVEENQMTQM